MTKPRILAVTAALALGGGGAAAATAATTKAPSEPRPSAQFESRLAKELGVSVEKLRAATESSGLGTVRALRAGGKLDAGRAAKLEKAIGAGRAVPLTQLGKPRRGAKASLGLLSKALGAKPKDLRAAAKAGKTPAAIITAAGKDPAAVATSIQTTVRARLDKGVKAGRLTAAQADERAAKRAARLTADQPLGKQRG